MYFEKVDVSAKFRLDKSALFDEKSSFLNGLELAMTLVKCAWLFSAWRKFDIVEFWKTDGFGFGRTRPNMVILDLKQPEFSFVNPVNGICLPYQ